MSTAELLLLFLVMVLAGTLTWMWRRKNACETRNAEISRQLSEATTAKAELQRRLEQGREYLERLGDANLDGLILLDQSRKVLWGNRVAWDMFQVSAPAVGQPFIGLVRDYELNQAVVDASAGNRPMVRQAVVGERSLRIHVVPVEPDLGFAVAIEDVSELQRLGRARRDFVANISHELRTPLANIGLAAQTLREGGTRDAALTGKMLDQIARQVQSLSQLSQEMMDLAQIESGQVLLKMVPVELEPLVRRSVQYLVPQAAMKHQHLTLVIPSGMMVLADEQQVGRVVSNLVHNAVKFTPEGGIISVYAEAVGEDVQVCVSDTGPGIPEADQPRIFERFFKQDRARSSGGTGLGLAIARHIVEGHGGRIWVTSQPPQGANFCFTLPRA